MINILYVINESELGGAALSLLDMIEKCKSTINPIVIIPKNGMIEDRLQFLNIKHYIIFFERDSLKLGFHTKTKVDSIFTSNYTAALELQEIIQKEDIQIIHSNSSVSNVGAIAAIMAGIPHIWHIRELMEDDFCIEYADKELKRKLFKSTELIISISNCVAKAYKNKYDVESVLLYDGLNIDRYLSEWKKDEGEEKINFIIAGEITPNKDQGTVIKAIDKLVKEGKENIHLYIVGSELYQYQWILSKYIKQHMLLKFIDIFPYRDDLKVLRSKCQYSITASKKEALGRVTIEAMLARNIVIGANTGGTLELVGTNGIRGYLYRQGDYNNLAEVIERAVSNKEKNVKMLDEAQVFAKEHFDSQKYAKKIIKIYENMLHRENKSSDEKKRLLSEMQVRYKMLGSSSQNTWQDSSKEIVKLNEKWTNIKREGLLDRQILTKRKLKTVAIYGMGKIGCELYDELERIGVSILYVMDRAMSDTMGVVNCINIEEKLPAVDAIVITVLKDSNLIAEELRKKCDYFLVTIKDIVMWCEEDKR